MRSVLRHTTRRRPRSVLVVLQQQPHRYGQNPPPPPLPLHPPRAFATRAKNDREAAAAVPNSPNSPPSSAASTAAAAAAAATRLSERLDHNRSDSGIDSGGISSSGTDTGTGTGGLPLFDDGEPLGSPEGAEDDELMALTKRFTRNLQEASEASEAARRQLHLSAAMGDSTNPFALQEEEEARSDVKAFYVGRSVNITKAHRQLSTDRPRRFRRDFLMISFPDNSASSSSSPGAASADDDAATTTVIGADGQVLKAPPPPPPPPPPSPLSSLASSSSSSLSTATGAATGTSSSSTALSSSLSSSSLPQPPTPLGFGSKHMVVFNYGSVVFFNFSDLEVQQHLHDVRPFCSEAIPREFQITEDYVRCSRTPAPSISVLFVRVVRFGLPRRFVSRSSSHGCLAYLPMKRLNK